MWPVPVTGQTLGVLLVGATLGARRGALALTGYAGLGLAGAPVFAGGAGGVAIAALFGLAVGGAVPFIVSANTTLVPAALLAVLGLAGAAVSLRPVVSADPNSALGAAR